MSRRRDDTSRLKGPSVQPILDLVLDRDRWRRACQTYAPDPNPRDGEKVTGVELDGPCLVLFKETKSYILYGTSTERDGSVTYDYFVRPRR